MAVTTALVLVSPQDSEPFCIETDSSDFASRVVLSQQLPREDKWHPVAFYSKSLSPVEWNYEIHNKEMLTIIHTLNEWRHFLEGAWYLVEIWTDHKNLEYFMMAKKLNHCQAHWSLYLVCFDFKFIHYPGCSIGKLDAIAETRPWQWSLWQQRCDPPTTGALGNPSSRRSLARRTRERHP